LPRALLPPYERESSKIPWPPWPSMTKYPTSSEGWTTTETRSHSPPVIDLKGMLLTTRPECRTSSYQRGTANINRHIGSNSWPKGKWQGSPGSTFQGKPHLSQKCMLPQPQDKKTSWGPYMPCLDGFGRCSQDPPPITARCSSMLRLLTIGEWSERSSDSDSSSIICRTSTSKSPITRLSSEEYRRPRPWPRDGWSSPTSITMRWTYASSVLNLEEEHDPTSVAPNNGEGWIPSR
jgi:hypothetical protein